MKDRRLIDLAFGITMFLVLFYAGLVSRRADLITESNLTLTRMLDEQMELNRERLTALELKLEGAIHGRIQPPRVADSLFAAATLK